MEDFSFDTTLKKIDIEFDDSQFNNEAQIVKVTTGVIDQVNMTYCYVCLHGVSFSYDYIHGC